MNNSSDNNNKNDNNNNVSWYFVVEVEPPPKQSYDPSHGRAPLRRPFITGLLQVSTITWKYVLAQISL